MLLVVLLVGVPGLCPGWEGRVTQVEYADQIKVLREGTVETVRLYGIDAPIDPQPFGQEALWYTKRRVLGKTVEVKPLIRDHWDRIIAWVFVDGENLNKELLRHGIAWWYKKYLPFDKELEALETEARAARVGLWALPNPIPPWEFQPLPPSEPAGPEREGVPRRRGMAGERLREETGLTSNVHVREGQARRAVLEHLEELKRKYGTAGQDVPASHDAPRSEE